MTLAVEDAYFKAVYVVSEVEVGVVERLGASLVKADSLIIAWQQHFYNLGADWKGLVTAWTWSVQKFEKVESHNNQLCDLWIA